MAERVARRFDAQLTWLPYDLHPEYPPEGIDRRAFLERVGDPGHERMRARFAQAGLVLNTPPDTIPNSMLALRLTELARDHGLHDALHARLMDAYWAEGRDIGDREVLRELAAEVGLDEPDTAWADETFRERVLASTEHARAIGVTGIPGFLLDRRLLVLGAQPEEVFEQAFARLSEPGPDPGR